MEKRPSYKELERQLEEAKKELKKTDALKDAFLANMSHEIRTPMNAIVGASELLRDNTLPKEDRNEFTRILRTSSKELLFLFNRILELSQLESGAIGYQEEEFNLNKLLQDIYTDYNRQISEQQKDLHLTLFEEVENLRLQADFDKLSKVIHYLLENALKFTEHGEVDFGYAIQSKKYILFYVKDTGPGIDKKQQAKIFKKFTQIDNSYTRVHSGAGLGLCLCKEMIRIMGGHLNLDSSLGNGSIFYFTIPLKYNESNVILHERIKSVLKKNAKDIYSIQKNKNIAI